MHKQPKLRVAIWAAAGVTLSLGVVTCADPAPIMGPDRPSASVTVPSPVVLAAGDISSCSSTGDEQTADLINAMPEATVLALGDLAYESSTAIEYQNCYEPTWGQFKDRTVPVIGNHEYNSGTATPTFDYFGDAAFHGSRPNGYYSFDLGEWHIIVLNDNKTFVPIKAGSAQHQWLLADLAANTKECVMAVMHRPRFWSTAAGSSAPGVDPKPLDAWRALYQAGADLVLTGHQHFYERFALQDPDGNATPEGIRQIIVGTGGRSVSGTPTVISPNSQVRSGGSKKYGVLKLTLDPGSYSWEYIGVVGNTFTDQGTTSCHSDAPNAAPTAAPGGPYTGNEGMPLSFDGRNSSDPENQALTYAWNFGDGATGTGAQPSHTYAAAGEYTVTLTVTDALGLASAPATTTATVLSAPPAVNAGPDLGAAEGADVNLSASFTDAPADGPWSYSIDWGDGASSNGTSSSPATPITATHAYATSGGYTLTVTVTDQAGTSGSDVALVNVGGVVLVGASDIARCDRTNDEATAALLDNIPGTVFTAGDNVFVSGAASEFNDCYGASWGRHKARTRPAPGDKEYGTPGATPYFDYFGTAAGDPTKGYYSYNLGAWHIIVLNSAISTSAGSVQEQWLRADLQANPQQCTLAIWHHVRFSSGASTARGAVKPLWDALYQFGADVVIGGHHALYERFAPQTPDGIADPATGIRQFTVGKGGHTTSSIVTVAANSEVRNNSTFGVLKLTLNAGGYGWQFVPVAGQTFTDSGNGNCH